jgi:hypothetical protein
MPAATATRRLHNGRPRNLESSSAYHAPVFIVVSACIFRL